MINLLEPFAIISILFVVICTFLIYNDAKCRDHLPATWIVIGCLSLYTTISASRLLGLLSMIIILTVYLTSRPQGVLVKCPHCHKKILIDVAFCNRCKMPVKHECLHCHEIVPWEAVQCPSCHSTNITVD